MGAGVSSVWGLEVDSRSPGTGLGDLPEGCAAAILLHLDPPEICRTARINRAFSGAASANFVWGTKLPENYRYLMGLVTDEESRKAKTGLTMKEIYTRLCRPNPFHGGNKEFWMEKSRGGICLAISSKALVITGIDDRRYWNHIPTEESRFHSVAYLQQIWWFEVVGEIDFCFPAGTYSLYFRIHLGRASKRFGRRVCNSEHVHGWQKKPVRLQLSTSDGQKASSQYYLDKSGSWILYHAGDFVVANSNICTKLKFSMTQIDCTHTKGGLCVDSVFIYPKGYRQEIVATTYM